MGELFTPRVVHVKKTSVVFSKDTEFYDHEHFRASPVKRDSRPVPKSIVAIRDDDWKSLVTSITYLFHKKQLPRLELDVLNEKVRNVRASKKGAFIVECYKDSILKKGMIVLREPVKEKKGNELLERLAEVWSSFYRNILPMLLAIFYPIQEQGTHIRAVTLVGFRDMVLLKTKVVDALDNGGKALPEIKQMLLVLASVHDTSPPNENYLRLEQLLSRVVSPYLGTNGLLTSDQAIKRNSSDPKFQNGSTKFERKLSVSQMLKEEVTRKFRRSGSLSSSGNHNTNNTSEANNNKEPSSLKKRFRIGDYSPAPAKSSAISDASELTKAVVDNEMLAYLEERNQRWKKRDEMLGSESLLE